MVEQKDKEFYFEPIRFWWHCDGCGIEREIVESKAKPGLDVSCSKCKTHAILADVRVWQVKQTLPEGMVKVPPNTTHAPHLESSPEPSPSLESEGAPGTS